MSIKNIITIVTALYLLITVLIGFAAWSALAQNNKTVGLLRKELERAERAEELHLLITASEMGYRYHAEGVSLQKLTNDVAAIYRKGGRP